MEVDLFTRMSLLFDTVSSAEPSAGVSSVDVFFDCSKRRVEEESLVMSVVVERRNGKSLFVGGIWGIGLFASDCLASVH